MEGEVILSLFLIGMGAWLIFQGFLGIRDHRDAHNEPDDPFEADEPDLRITVTGVTLIFGLASSILGLYILFV